MVLMLSLCEYSQRWCDRGWSERDYLVWGQSAVVLVVVVLLLGIARCMYMGED